MTAPANRLNALLRGACLLLLLALLPGCGQKGDLYRPGKQGNAAAGAGNSAQA